jgi:hypothetical protein
MQCELVQPRMSLVSGMLRFKQLIWVTCCYIYEVSLDTQQCWTALARLVDNNLNKQQCYAGNNR